MATLLDDLAAQLTPQTIERMSAQIGAQPQQTVSAIEAALPILLGQLQRNAASPQGANALLAALDRDHDGSILDDLAGFLGGGPTQSNARSLDHIFGGRRGTVEGAVSRRSGLDGAQVMRLLAMLAPVLLGILNRQRTTGGSGLPAGDPVQTGGGAGNILGDLLNGALGQMQQRQPGLGGMLGGLLDSDGDGSIVDDLLEMGLGGGAQRGRTEDASDPLGDLLGGLLRGRR